MSATRFTFLGARFIPSHRRFTVYEGKSNLVSRPFHRCFIPTPFVSRFTPIGMKYETRLFTAISAPKKPCFVALLLILTVGA
jgi:hypothetical protein